MTKGRHEWCPEMGADLGVSSDSKPRVLPPHPEKAYAPLTQVSLYLGLTDTGPQVPKRLPHPGEGQSPTKRRGPGGQTQKLAQVQPPRQIKLEPPEEGIAPSSHCPHLVLGSCHGHPWPLDSGSKHNLPSPFHSGVDATRSLRGPMQLGSCVTGHYWICQ